MSIEVLGADEFCPRLQLFQLLLEGGASEVLFTFQHDHVLVVAGILRHDELHGFDAAALWTEIRVRGNDGYVQLFVLVGVETALFHAGGRRTGYLVHDWLDGGARHLTLLRTLGALQRLDLLLGEHGKFDVQTRERSIFLLLLLIFQAFGKALLPKSNAVVEDMCLFVCTALVIVLPVAQPKR